MIYTPVLKHGRHSEKPLETELSNDRYSSRVMTIYTPAVEQPIDSSKDGAMRCGAGRVDSPLQTLSMGTLIRKMRRLGCFSTQAARALFPTLGAAHPRPRIGVSPRILECARSTAQCWAMAVFKMQGERGGGRRGGGLFTYLLFHVERERVCGC